MRPLPFPSFHKSFQHPVWERNNLQKSRMFPASWKSQVRMRLAVTWLRNLKWEAQMGTLVQGSWETQYDHCLQQFPFPAVPSSPSPHPCPAVAADTHSPRRLPCYLEGSQESIPSFFCLLSGAEPKLPLRTCTEESHLTWRGLEGIVLLIKRKAWGLGLKDIGSA